MMIRIAPTIGPKSRKDIKLGFLNNMDSNRLVLWNFNDFKGAYRECIDGMVIFGIRETLLGSKPFDLLEGNSKVPTDVEEWANMGATTFGTNLT